uniref:Uncharacterized protein n=1 Tax=Setaria viridis TaxID=4556 RepID=A0A4V6D7G5_SETVI|nr:hypothetical protein SEVIR_5G412200v2 [Setaria viridis]
MRSDSCSVGQCVLWKAHQSPWRQGWHMVCFAMADTRQTCMGARHTPPIQHSLSICFCLLDMCDMKLESCFNLSRIFCSNLKQTVGYFCKI